MSNVKYIVRQCLLEFIDETKKIRRVDMSKINPTQLNIDDWAAIEDDDAEFNSKHNLQGKEKLDTPSLYNAPMKGKPQKYIDIVQRDLTKKAKANAKASIGSDFVPIKDMEVSHNVKKMLEDNGLEVEVTGKTFSYGNTKLPPSTMIINLTSAMNCPSSNCPLRKKICYARRYEPYRKEVQLRNLRNQYTSKFLGIKDILKLIETYIEQAPCRIKQIRISEDGDFENQEQVNALDKIAAHLYAKYGIKTACYTHRSDLNFRNCKDMIVNMSDPKSDQGDRYYLAVSTKEFDQLEYGGIKQDNNGDLYFKCHCNCKRCNFCYNTKEENGEPIDGMVKVKCEIH